MRVIKILVISIVTFSTTISVGCKKKSSTSTPAASSSSAASTFQSGNYLFTNRWFLSQSPSTSTYVLFNPSFSKLIVSGSSVTFYFDTQNWSTSFISGTINSNNVTLNPFSYTNTNGTKSSMLTPSLNLLPNGTIDYIYTAQQKTSLGVVACQNVVKVNFKKQ
jgi:hypothetical protein